MKDRMLSELLPFLQIVLLGCLSLLQRSLASVYYRANYLTLLPHLLAFAILLPLEIC